jgi:ankyrin repeat protein
MSELTEACAIGDIERVKKLLKRGVGLNSRCPRMNTTPLHIACYKGDLELFKVLMSYNVHLNAVDGSGLTPLLILCARCNQNTEYELTYMAMLLIEKGAKINTSQRGSRVSPLHMACFKDCLPMVTMLLKYGSHVNCDDVEYSTPLHSACRSDSTGMIVKLLCEWGAAIRRNNIYQRTPLHEACIGGKYHAAAQLLSRGVNVNCTDLYGRTPLGYVDRIRDCELFQLLLDAGAVDED